MGLGFLRVLVGVVCVLGGGVFLEFLGFFFLLIINGVFGYVKIGFWGIFLFDGKKDSDINIVFY